jgi:adenylate cyclase class IV
MGPHELSLTGIIMKLEDQQKNLRISLIDYDLESMWRAHPLIAQLRERIEPLLPKGLYDAQDLEHQVLFRLTTFDPKDITDEIIQHIVEEQYCIVNDRLSKLDFDLEYLFRGLSGKHRDLNVHNRLELSRSGDKLTAKNQHHAFNVDFRVVHDEHIISLFTNELHYIHRDRPKGEVFGFYFSGDDIPWAIETTEPSVISKTYKREALLANGIDPNKAVELTRFYTLPGAPTNAISLMDGLVSKYYKAKGIEALFTTTMPMYSKTKSSTIAGGINKVLLVKDLRHKFVPEKINNVLCYRHVTTVPENRKEAEYIQTHPNFPTMLVVEVYKLINEPSLQPLEVLRDEKKVIYVRQRESKTEKEVKFLSKDIAATLAAVRGVAQFSHVEYLRDVIYGTESDKKKIRLRVRDNFERTSLEAMYKYKIAADKGIKMEIEEILYKGERKEDALLAIARQGAFKEENSYEKIRAVHQCEDAEITLDIYPYGVWVEIEGEPERIWELAERLGYKKSDGITENADELYLEWNKKWGLKELWDVRFGLTGEK